MKKQYGWHFVNKTLRDGSPIPPDGEWLEFKGVAKMCESGLHFSPTPWKALEYAPGATLCYVEVENIVEQDKNKGVCTRRKIIAKMDATEALRYFARMQALSVIHTWDAPDVVCDYLMTGDEDIRAAARDAAWAAAWAAATDAATDAAWDAAWAAFNDLIYECFEDVLHGIKD